MELLPFFRKPRFFLGRNPIPYDHCLKSNNLLYLWSYSFDYYLCGCEEGKNRAYKRGSLFSSWIWLFEVAITPAPDLVNSLRQVIRRNKADMADDAGKSLDLMRRIFQNEITKELQQIMDRHIRTTFSPAIENLKKNGHVVDQDVINDLYTSILDAAKAPFTRERASTMNRDRLNSERSKRGYESDESDVSILSQSSEIKRRRGRPRK
ncbi:hypothetical protein ANCDUO_16369, partial [Ancylostoma duodenale]